MNSFEKIMGGDHINPTPEMIRIANLDPTKGEEAILKFTGNLALASLVGWSASIIAHNSNGEHLGALGLAASALVGLIIGGGKYIRNQFRQIVNGDCGHDASILPDYPMGPPMHNEAHPGGA